MVNRSRLLPCGIDPRLEYFKDEEIVFCHHARIDDLAFKIGITLVDERCPDARGGRGRETEAGELVDLAS